MRAETLISANSPIKTTNCNDAPKKRLGNSIKIIRVNIAKIPANKAIFKKIFNFFLGFSLCLKAFFDFKIVEWDFRE